MSLLLTRTALALLALYTIGWGYRIYLRKYYIWLPDYVRWTLQMPEKPKGPIHIFFVNTDHFEPGEHVERTRQWASDYPRLAARHRDSSGRPVQHTWFYPADDPVDENMQILHELVAAGYGEVELHLHHQDPTRESAERRYRHAIDYFQQFGFLKTVDGQTRFAFAHGNNALDNGLGGQWCGVNTELSLLRELGCFADFSFPSVWAEAQPSMVNQIYVASDNPHPKSYDRGEPLRVGQPVRGDLVIFTGPLLFAPALDLRHLFFVLEGADIHSGVPLTTKRVDLWVRAGIHVEGRPEWIFVRTVVHGASSKAEIEEMLGPRFDNALSHLESRYNDGAHYLLHYVTAREAYNVALAAAAGLRGDPTHYFNWKVPPYVADAATRQQPPARHRPAYCGHPAP